MIEVEDDGPGIPEDAKPAIGRRGVRADPKIGGHGIGLAVVREIVEGVYGGRLELGRGALGGALVRVWL
ncbi:MAG: ATP-binding protein [Gammaproteobacteria bacterium]